MKVENINRFTTDELYNDLHPGERFYGVDERYECPFCGSPVIKRVSKGPRRLGYRKYVCWSCYKDERGCCFNLFKEDELKRRLDGK